LKTRTKLFSENGVLKHVGSRIVVCDLSQFRIKVKKGEYIAKDCTHLKNMKVWIQKDLNFVLQQINKTPRKGYQKMV
jgi:hypothetical protein